jgi:hypothetical protein
VDVEVGIVDDPTEVLVSPGLECEVRVVSDLGGADLRRASGRPVPVARSAVATATAATHAAAISQALGLFRGVGG